MKSFIKFSFISILIYFSSTGTAFSFTFTPTLAEFHRWPYFCQAMYARTNVARKNGFWKLIPKAEADKWFKIGDRNGGAWHYCAGLTHLDQAEAALLPAKRNKLFNGAIADVMFSVERTDNASPWMALYIVALGRAYRGLEQYNNAVKILNESIRNFPSHINAYSLLSLVYRDKNDLQSAEKILLQGDKVSNGKNPEINYFLGMVSVDLGKIKEAKQYAAKASKLGYPMKGLSDKIRKKEKK